jgi:hypothetical protein
MAVFTAITSYLLIYIYTAIDYYIFLYVHLYSY